MEDPTPTVDAPNKPHQRFRRTRIAVSLFFGVITVLVCVMWVRSLTYADHWVRIGGGLVLIKSNYGYLSCIYDPEFAKLQRPGPWSHRSAPSDGKPYETTWQTLPMGPTELAFPHWWIGLSLATVTFLPWSATSFSLRTMLIATTLVAVVLGLAVWMER